MTIIWCIVPEIWSTTDRISCHFGPFFAPNNPKKHNFEKLKKTPGDIILNMFTINDNHIMYSSWDMKCDGQNFLSFWTVFCPFTPLTTWKINILKKWKKTPGDIIILHMYTKNHDHMLYCSLDMVLSGCHFYFLFWAVFCPFTSLTAKKSKFKKNEKKAWRYHHFTKVYQKSWSYAILFLIYGAWQM